MSYPQVQTTNYYLNAIADDGDDVLTSESKLNMMKFPVAGSAQTYDSTSFCPDSASTATSISTGHKTYSGNHQTWMKRWKLLMRRLLRN